MRKKLPEDARKGTRAPLEGHRKTTQTDFFFFSHLWSDAGRSPVLRRKATGRKDP